MLKLPATSWRSWALRSSAGSALQAAGQLRLAPQRRERRPVGIIDRVVVQVLQGLTLRRPHTMELLIHTSTSRPYSAAMLRMWSTLALTAS